jgi:GPH family glycoside/pentoside/hexuronide:cation symporter
LISDVLISDIIDEDFLNTKTHREGMYFGTNAFVTRFAIALEAICIGLIFTLTGYNPVVFTQTVEFLSGLRWLISGLPVIALVLAFFIMYLYPLDEEHVSRVVEDVSSSTLG